MRDWRACIWCLRVLKGIIAFFFVFLFSCILEMRDSRLFHGSRIGGALLPDRSVSGRMGEFFCLCIGRGISEGDIIYLLYTAAVHIYMMRNCSCSCEKGVYREYMGKMVFFISKFRHCAYRAKYVVVGGLYMVW